MKPILYHSGETTFDNNGIGVLADAVSCKVTEELDGAYELEMKYPVDGQHFTDIKLRCLILAKPNKTDRPQPFRVYRIAKPLRGVVTIYGEHISYDLAGIPVNVFTAGDAPAAMEAIKANSAIDNPFSFYTDKSTVATMNVDTPRSARSCVFGQSGSLLDTYTGDLFFDRYNVSLLASRGSNKGVRIAYGKNLTDLKQEENIAETYTGIYPYGVDADGNLTVLPEKIIRAEGEFGYERIKEVDLSAAFMEETGEQIEITEEALRTEARKYMKTRRFGVPKVSINVSFVQLADTEEYKNIALLEDVSLGDTVTVEFSKLGVSAASRCVKTVFDSLTERFEKATIGEVTRTIADSFLDVPTKEFIRGEDASTRASLNKAIERATELLNGANGGVFEILDENNDGINDAWLLRTYDALKYIKATADGIGLTVDGGASYRTAVTADGINADAITTGLLSAERIDVENLVARSVLVNDTDGNVLLSAKNNAVIIGGWTVDKDSFGTYGAVADTLFLSQSGKAAYWSEDLPAESWHIFAKGKSGLTTGGILYARDAVISGTITAEDGRIGSAEQGWSIDNNSIFHGESFSLADVFLCTGSNTSQTIAGHTGNGWVFKAGDSFGVNNKGALYCTAATLTGKITATGGKIGGFDITSESLSKTTVETSSSGAYEYVDTTIIKPALISVESTTRYPEEDVLIPEAAIAFSRTTTIQSGLISVNISGVELVADPPIMTVTIQGTSYDLYIDTATNTVKVR